MLNLHIPSENSKHTLAIALLNYEAALIYQYEIPF